MESESRAPDPSDNGSLSLGPHEGGKATPTMETSGVHTKPMSSSGSLGLLINGSENGSPDPVDGGNGGRFGSIKVSALATETFRTAGVQKTPAKGSSRKFRFTISVCLVQRRGSGYASGDKNPLEEFILIELGQGFSEERGSGAVIGAGLGLCRRCWAFLPKRML